MTNRRVLEGVASELGQRLGPKNLLCSRERLAAATVSNPNVGMGISQCADADSAIDAVPRQVRRTFCDVQNLGMWRSYGQLRVKPMLA
jgi:hypothetical protein